MIKWIVIIQWMVVMLVVMWKLVVNLMIIYHVSDNDIAGGDVNSITSTAQSTSIPALSSRDELIDELQKKGSTH